MSIPGAVSRLLGIFRFGGDVGVGYPGSPLRCGRDDQVVVARWVVGTLRR